MKPFVNTLLPLSVSEVTDPSEFQGIDRHWCSVSPKMFSMWEMHKVQKVTSQSQLQQMFSPSPGKGSNIISILLGIWRIHRESGLTQAAQEDSDVLKSHRWLKPVIFCLALLRVTKEITAGNGMLVSNYTSSQQCRDTGNTFLYLSIHPLIKPM